MPQQQSATKRILKIAGLLAGVLLVLAGAGFWMGFLGGGNEGTSVETAEVQRRDVTQTVTAFGSYSRSARSPSAPMCPARSWSWPSRRATACDAGSCW